MRYSQEFKDNVVARLLSKELSISEAVERYSIGKSTISYWLRIAREQAVCGTLPKQRGVCRFLCLARVYG